MIGPSGFMAGPKTGDKMICKHATNGCNYPESECLGDCDTITRMDPWTWVVGAVGSRYESASHTNKIKAMRHRTGMTQRELAARLHVSERTYIRWEAEGSISNGAALELLQSLAK